MAGEWGVVVKTSNSWFNIMMNKGRKKKSKEPKFGDVFQQKVLGFCRRRA